MCSSGNNCFLRRRNGANAPDGVTSSSNGGFTTLVGFGIGLGDGRGDGNGDGLCVVGEGVEIVGLNVATVAVVVVSSPRGSLFVSLSLPSSSLPPSSCSCPGPGGNIKPNGGNVDEAIDGVFVDGDGALVASFIVGFNVGIVLGFIVGARLGNAVGLDVVGIVLGIVDGIEDGRNVGKFDGNEDGRIVGNIDGIFVGLGVIVELVVAIIIFMIFAVAPLAPSDAAVVVVLMSLHLNSHDS